MNPFEPSERHLDIRRRFGIGQLWPRHHNDRQSKLARGGDFRIGRVGTRILGDDDLDGFAGQKTFLPVYIEGSARCDHAAIRKLQRRGECIDGADQIVVVRRGEEGRDFKLSDRKKNSARYGSQTARSVRHTGCIDPDVALLPHPGRAFEPQQRNGGFMRGMNRVGRHLRGKWMGRIDQRVDGTILQVTPQSLDAAETAYPVWNRRRNDVCRPSSERDLRLEPHIAAEPARETACFRRSPKNEDIDHAGCHDA